VWIIQSIRMCREEVKWKFGTCAVVSNSGELLRQKMGNEIDDHHAVFRINYPPIEGFTVRHLCAEH